MNFSTSFTRPLRLLWLALFTLSAAVMSAQTYCATSYAVGTGSGDWIQFCNITGTTLNNVSGASPVPYYISGTTTASLTQGSFITTNVGGGSVEV